MCSILPAILARDADDFRKRIMHRELRRVAPLWHVDVLDGSMFASTAWSDPVTIGAWKDLPRIELHVMSHNPLPHIEAWHLHVPSLERAIIHAEIARPLGAILERIRAIGVGTGLALNPETPVEKLEHSLEHVDIAQIMGVHPGASGRPFEGEAILAKISRAHHLFPHLRLSVDGGIRPHNARAMIDAGATQLVASSALWSHADPEDVYEILQKNARIATMR